jgi:RNA polymerase sigma factor (sigma-70 family)
MLGICMRYCRDRAEAEDVLQEGFIKVFTNIIKYRGEGSFEGWIKRIMVNTAIDNYQGNLKHYFHSRIEDLEDTLQPEEHSAPDPLLEQKPEIPNEKLMELVQALPDGYRLVFNLYAIEGYGHKEIGEMLNISENTSKTQLMKARKTLRKCLSELVHKYDYNDISR